MFNSKNFGTEKWRKMVPKKNGATKEKWCQAPI